MPAARVAAIDVGTNSVLLLVADVHNGVIGRIFQDESREPRLGLGLNEDHLLQPDSQQRTINALNDLRRTAEAFHVNHWCAAGTSALRDATNRDAFLVQVKREAGITIRVISGQEEAQLVHQGVLADPHLPGSAATIVDIGGGSTEFIWRDQADIHAFSVDVGSSRLLTRVPDQDPPTLDGVQRFRDEAVRSLTAQLSAKVPTNPLVLVGGTAKTLVAMAIMGGSIDGKPPVILNVAHIDERLASLARSTRVQRLAMPGLPSPRVDTIVSGAAIVRAVCDVLDVDELHVSTYGLRHGLAISCASAP